MDQIQVEVQAIYGTDIDVANAAWTSSLTKQGKDKRSFQDVARICKMVTDDGHGTPIESIIFRFWVRMPIATDRQWMTHRIASHNGMSGRYRTMPNDFLQMPEDIQKILDDWYNVSSGNDLNSDQYGMVCLDANSYYNAAVKELKEGQENGKISNKNLKRTREFVRGMLPQHNMTERTTIINLRSFSNMIVHRISSHAQPEIRDVVTKLYKAIVAHKDFKNISQTWYGLAENHFRTTPLPDTELLDALYDEPKSI